MIRRAALLAVLAASGVAGAAPPPELLLLVGSASRPVLEAARPRIEADLGVRLAVSYGSSGALLSQLELARRGDVYLPGSHDYLERAVARGLVDPATRVDLAYLIPALVVRRGNPRGVHAVADLARPGVRAAIAEPRTVCAGLYAREILERAGIAARVLPRLGRARSCAALAGMLAVGSVDAVLGWRVFARWYPDRLEVVPLPPRLVRRVATVPGAVTSVARRPEAARRVLAWLAGPRGRAIWRAHGYLVDRAAVAAFAPGARIGG